MSEACIGCKSLRYTTKYIPYCCSIGTLRCYTIPKCPCKNCLVKMICHVGCEEFDKAAREYECYVSEIIRDQYAGGRIKRKAV